MQGEISKYSGSIDYVSESIHLSRIHWIVAQDLTCAPIVN